MIKRSVCILLTVAALLASCATQRKAPARGSAAETSAAKQDSPASYPSEVKLQFFYTEGIKQAKLNGNRGLAGGLFSKVLEFDSTHAPSYYQLAALYLYNDPQKALEYSQKANSLDSTQVLYKSQLGRLLINTRHYSQAKDVYEELMTLAPTDPNNYSMLSALYQQTGQPYTALGVLDKAEEVLGKQEQLSSYKRELLVGLKLYDRAINEAREMTTLYPYSYENYLALAELYATTRKDSLAMHNYVIAQQLEPDAVDVMISLNEYYKAKGDYINHFTSARQLMKSDDITVESKVAFFKEMMVDRAFYRDNFYYINDLTNVLLDKYPNEYDVVRLAADNLIALGEVPAAGELYKSRLNDSIPDRRLYDQVIDIETYLERADSVEKYIGQAFKLFPKDANLYVKYGNIVSFLDRDKGIDRAVVAYEDAYKYADSDSLRSAVMGLIGDIYQSDGKLAKSSAAYKKAIKLNPDNILALNNYAYNLSEKGKDLDRALEMSKRVMELEPGNATYIDTYGWVLYKLGRYDEAKKALMQAVALDTDSSKELLLHYGDVLFALGENYMATVYWNRALKAGYDEEAVQERLEKAGSK